MSNPSEQTVFSSEQQIAQRVLEDFRFIESSLVHHQAQVTSCAQRLQQSLCQLIESSCQSAGNADGRLNDEKRAHLQTKSNLQHERRLLAQVKYAAIAERQKFQHEDQVKLDRIRTLEAEAEAKDSLHAKERNELLGVILRLEGNEG